MEYAPDGYKKLSELYTDVAFKAMLASTQSAVVSAYHFTVSADLEAFTESYLWDWYEDNFVVFTADTDAEIRAKFEKRVRMAYADHWVWLQAQWDLYKTALASYQSLIAQGSMTTHRANSGTDERTVDLTRDLTDSSFTKQADTPTTENPASDFVDAYTNYQSKTSNDRTGTQSTTDSLVHGLASDMELNRKASVDSALKTMESAKRHLADDITNLFGNAFITVYEF